ncbi:hypothetical protein HaLaN_17084 [Haematococcus lacustris]|uniref:Uncharacterized protein n=1 Tax=Haematococcus lacustris TaxID=44745 RepID=A0A699ZD28_HAELA|nr:hypothetical protein HaLaN_17084 [Haematococcus lacustris]
MADDPKDNAIKVDEVLGAHRLHLYRRQMRSSNKQQIDLKNSTADLHAGTPFSVKGLFVGRRRLVTALVAALKSACLGSNWYTGSCVRSSRGLGSLAKWKRIRSVRAG